MSVHPHANCTLVQQIAQADDALEHGKVDLFVTGVEAVDGDTLDLVSRFARHAHGTGATLVITRRAAPRLLAALRGMSVGGVFDASNDEPDNFMTAMRESTNGRPIGALTFARHALNQRK